MHPLFEKADRVSHEVIGGAIEVHRDKGPGLIESIYERCLTHELFLRRLSVLSQKLVRIDYKGLTFEEPLRFDLLVEECLLIENKCVEKILPVHKAQLMTYMKLMNVPVGLIINYHEQVLRRGIVRMLLPVANQS